jgi:lysozyme
MDRQKLNDDLIRDEGLKLKVYKDSLGIETIGVGRNLRDKGLSTAEALYLLNNDLDECLADLRTFLPYFDDLDEVRQRVLTNMRFNLGPTRFRGFKNFLKCVRESRYKDAAIAMLESKWAKQVKGRARRLAKAMETGIG